MINKTNNVQFSGSRCGTCGEEMVFVSCNAVKIMECEYNIVTIYHLAPYDQKKEKSPKVTDSFRQNRPTGAKHAARNVMRNQLEIGRSTADRNNVRNAKQRINEEENMHSVGMEAVANLQRKVSTKDEFFIFKMNDEAINGERT